MGDHPSTIQIDRATWPGIEGEDPPSGRLVRAVEVVLASVIIPPLLVTIALVGIFTAVEWCVLRVHDLVRPHDRRLGRAIWGRLESRPPARAGHRSSGGHWRQVKPGPASPRSTRVVRHTTRTVLHRGPTSRGRIAD